jgi:tetratricopeptide (TPR) repeat protein
MKASKNIFILITIMLSCVPFILFAQNDKQIQAHSYLENKDYTKAANLYKDLRNENIDNVDVYNDYLFVLIQLKDYKRAEDLAKDQQKRYSNNPMYLIDLGNVYKADNKSKKANELFEHALKYVNGDDNLTQQMGNALSNSGNEDYAIKVYERAIEITQNPSLYSAPLSRLYNLAGQTEKAISTIISSNQGMPMMRGEESVETTLLELVGKDSEKIKLAQKAIIKLVNLQPDNFYYTYLLVWIFSLQDNWDQALTQVQALEKRNTDKGRLLMDFANSALKKEQYEIAIKAYNTVIGYGNTNPRYTQAREVLLKTKLQQIVTNPSFTQSDVSTLQKDYADYFATYPHSIGTPIVNDYALLEAQYANNIDHAIELLKSAINNQGTNKFFAGNCKLQLGDYYIITGNIWDAALLYSQVDKTFREDVLGEEARFRNAKLSYYQGDFEMAQGQLSVLKASTSELIANDALFLSVLITENVPPDSNLIPLKRFAYADLLLFQNKDQEAEHLLDSIAIAFPKHPLSDDILLLRAKIANKHRDYDKAINYLKQIVEQYGKDVLADDALFRMAEIYKQSLKKPDEAKKYYEQLIIDYPGSTYIQTARIFLKELEQQ